MSEKKCKWIKGEICVNDQCPMCADYCPTAQYPGVCRYEELVEVEEEMTVGKCFVKALEDVGINVPFEKAVEALSRFRELVDNRNQPNHDPHECNEVAVKEKDVGFFVGQRVSLDRIKSSDKWEMSGFSKDDVFAVTTYIAKDRTMIVSFADGDNWGTIMCNYGGI